MPLHGVIVSSSSGLCRDTRSIGAATLRAWRKLKLFMYSTVRDVELVRRSARTSDPQKRLILSISCIYTRNEETTPSSLFLDLGDQTHDRNHFLDRPGGGRGELGEHLWVTVGGDDIFWDVSLHSSWHGTFTERLDTLKALWRHISAEYTLLHAVWEQGSMYIESTGGLLRPCEG